MDKVSASLVNIAVPSSSTPLPAMREPARCPWTSRMTSNPNILMRRTSDPGGGETFHRPKGDFGTRVEKRSRCAGWLGIAVSTCLVASAQDSGSVSSRSESDGLSALPTSSLKLIDVQVSGDYLLGNGTISTPFNFALQGTEFSAPEVVELSDRDSTYWGTTLQVTLPSGWAVEFSYARGTSETSNLASISEVDSVVTYQLDDSWYQIFGKYTFPGLSSQRFSTEIRFGGSWVDSELSAQGNFLSTSYSQVNNMTDWLGNLGFGLEYVLKETRDYRFKVIGVLEGEGFAGVRNQDIRETVSYPLVDVTAPQVTGTTELDNLIYGGGGRLALRLFYNVTESGRLKVYADGGVQTRYTRVNYPDVETNVGGVQQTQDVTVGEVLWGPFVRVGLLYRF